jgi:hypothetical protein
MIFSGYDLAAATRSAASLPPHQLEGARLATGTEVRDVEVWPPKA